MSDHFGAVDYLVFAFMLSISSLIGLYYAWKDRNNKSQDQFLRGGKKMAVIPVCASIVASFLPSTSFIGFPTVVYVTGTQFWVIVIPAILAAVIACEVFIPVFYNMNLISVNEYLHKRFKSHNLQVIANISTLFAMIPFFGVELFAPAIALSIVTDLSIITSILILGCIVTFYTTLGGLKGVIWTDTIQFVLMFFGLVTVMIRGAKVSGGMAKAFDKAYQGGRVEFWNMNFDIYSMNSFWVMFTGFTILWAGTLCTSQLQIQRSICMPNLRTARKALYLAVPGFIIIISFTVVIGVLMYAKYYTCDPLLTGRVVRPDQLLPFFVLDIFEDDYPGLPGLFVACIFASSLSTLSSGLNAMASIIWDDYAKEIFYRLPVDKHVYATKLIAALIGVISIVCALIAKEANNIVEAAIMLYGAQNGPMFGLFVLGLFCPWANAIGGASAVNFFITFHFYVVQDIPLMIRFKNVNEEELVSGQILCLWVAIGSVSDKRDPSTMSLPLSTDSCAEQNITVYMSGAPLSMMKDYKIPDYYPTGAHMIHHMSPFFVPAYGFFISLLVGNVVSLVTKGNKDREIDVNLIHLKVCRTLEKLLPQSWRQLQNATQVMQMRSNPILQKTTHPINADSVRGKYYAEDEHDSQDTTVPVMTHGFNSVPDRTSNI